MNSAAEGNASASGIEAGNALAERLLAIMDRKNHWAFPHLTRPGLTRAQHLVHFRHEYATYVRDFPVLLGRVLGQVPPLEDVRTSLAENLYEEQTGRLSGTAPHPELFLRMMEGLGFTRDAFATERESDLEPEAIRYRDWLRDRSASEPWQAAVALMTIFVEGSINERAELAGTYVRAKGEDAVRKHPLVAHYGVPIEAMTLTRAHAAVEGAHRGDAWRMLLAHAPDDGPLADVIVATCEEALTRWLSYRDAVAAQMGIVRRAA